MKELIDITAGAVTHMYKPDHEKGHDYTFVQQFMDGAGLLANERIRSSELARQGKKMPLVNETLDYAISFPTVDQYNLYCKQRPEVIKALQSEIDRERGNAARQIERDHPEWVVSTPR